MNVPYFIARRIYGKDNGSQRFSRPAIAIATTGIAIGLAVVLISVAVVNGFKRDVSNKVIGFGSHAQVLSMTQTQDYEICPVVANDSLLRTITTISGVSKAVPFATKAGMLKTEDDFVGIQVKGIGSDYPTDFIKGNLIAGSLPAFSEKESSSKIIISNRIANQLKLKVGNKVFCYFINSASSKIYMRARHFEVVGIYETHLAEYDKVVCYTDIRTIRKLNKWESDEASGIEISVKDFDTIDQITDDINQRIAKTTDRRGATRGAFTIRELSPHLFAWLDVLDVNVIMILVLMILISGFTVISGMLIVMLERIRMIGILKALGATNTVIRNVFSNFALMMVLRGLLWGNILGLSLILAQHYFHFIKLDAETYYLDTVPVEMNTVTFLLVNTVVFVLSLCSIVVSSHIMSLKGPATTIRFE